MSSEHVYGHVLKGMQQFLLDEMAINLATEGVNTLGVVEDVKKQVRVLQKQALEKSEKLVACVRSVLVEENDGITPQVQEAEVLQTSLVSNFWMRSNSGSLWCRVKWIL